MRRRLRGPHRPPRALLARPGPDAHLGGGDDRITVDGYSVAELDGGPGRDFLDAGTASVSYFYTRDGEVDTIRCGPYADWIPDRDSFDVVLNPAECSTGP